MKKVFPLDNVALSLSNLSTTDALDPTLPQICRFCKRTPTPTCPPLLAPCRCPQPIHPPCLLDQMEHARRGQILESGPNKKFSCPKCSQTIRFHCETTLRCRTGSEILQTIGSNACVCGWLSAGTILMVGLLVLLAVFKASKYRFPNTVLCEATTIGLAIASSVLFLILTYFLVAELIVHRDVALTLTPSDPHRRKNSSRLEIVNCE